MEKGRDGSAYNIGGGSRITLNGAIALLEGIIGKKAKRDETASKKGDVLHTWSDTTLAQTELGFNPQYDVEKGLRKEVEWLSDASS
jgi:nucleoside-diphosphate-sugar epimerase